MNPIFTQMRIAVEDIDGHATLSPRSILQRAWSFIVSYLIRRKEDDAAQRYQGCAWCDSTEHDLNCDVMTGRHGRM